MAFEAVIYQIQIVTHLIGIGIICVLLECLCLVRDFLTILVFAFALACYLNNKWVCIFTTNECFGKQSWVSCKPIHQFSFCCYSCLISFAFCPVITAATNLPNKTINHQKKKHTINGDVIANTFWNISATGVSVLVFGDTHTSLW